MPSLNRESFLRSIRTTTECLPMETDAPSPFQAELRWLAVALVAATLASGALLMCPTGADPDLWGHLQFGRDVLAFGLPDTTTYAYTAEGYPWINHENLSEISFALTERAIGVAGMQFLKCLAAFVVLGTIAVKCWRTSQDVLAACVLTLVVALNLMCHWALRPQLSSYLFFACMLALLEHALPAGRRSNATESIARSLWLWWSIPLFVCWTNSHGGFLAGLAIFFCYCAGRGWQLLRSEDPGNRKVALRIGCVLVAVAGATLMNPYGIRLHLWLSQTLTLPRPEITEWHGLAADNPQTWLFSLLVIIWIAAIWRSRRTLDWVQHAVMLLTAWQACSHHRHIAFFAMLVGWWLGRPVADLFGWLRGADAPQEFGADMTSRSRRAMTGGLAAVTVLLACMLWGRLVNVSVDRASYPVSAVDFLARHHAEGNLVVTYNWAQYVIAALGARDGQMPGLRVAFDGRFRTCYPQFEVDQHFDFILGDLPGKRYRSPDSPPPDGAAVLRHADLVLLDRSQPHSEAVMHSVEQSWTLLYQDNIAQVWGRRSKFDDPTKREFLAQDQRILDPIPQTGSVAWPAIPVYPARYVGKTRAVRDDL